MRPRPLLGGLADRLKTVADAHPGKKIRLMFEDEARIGQKGRVCHRWYRKGQRPPGPADQRYTFAYLYAAVEPGTDNAFALVLPEVSTNAMQAFLDRLSATIAGDEHVLLVLDQAGWHGAKDLKAPDNITLTAVMLAFVMRGSGEVARTVATVRRHRESLRFARSRCCPTSFAEW
jgi:hypothetical protein